MSARRNILSFVIFPSNAANHLSEERFRAIVREHVLKLRAHALTVVADSIDEAFITLEVSERPRQVVLVW